mmetsp:Transcript_32962/g.75400  ORF Transcript_32962/g.75400 Transcript_32962/m.75400 type:complete len:864 (+) Transcript_32962:114-2705(+)
MKRNWKIPLPYGLKGWEGAEILPFQQDLVHSINARLLHDNPVALPRMKTTFTEEPAKPKPKKRQASRHSDKQKGDFAFPPTLLAATSPRQLQPGKTEGMLKRQLRKVLPIKVYLAHKGVHLNGVSPILETACMLPDHGPPDERPDHTRSCTFKVDESSQMWMCLGCEERGDIFHLMHLLEGADFWGAIEAMAYIQELQDKKDQGPISLQAILKGMLVPTEQAVAAEAARIQKLAEEEKNTNSVRADRGQIVFTPIEEGDENSDEEGGEPDADPALVIIKSNIATHKRRIQTKDPEGNSLNLSYLRLQPVDVPQLVPWLLPEAIVPLVVLNLQANTIGDNGCVAVMTALKHNTTLTKLNLSSNGIGPAGVKSLALYFKEKPPLVSLSFSRNRPEGHKMEEGGTGAAVESLARALEQNKSLTDLDMSCNNIAQRGGTALCQMLQENKTLKSVDLSWNQFGEACSLYVNLAVKSNPTCSTLSLAWDGLSNAGAAGVGDGLLSNTALTHLDLSCNHISEEGATKLAEALAENTTLVDLELNCNPVGNDGGASLLAAFKLSTTLLRLGLRGSSFSTIVTDKDQATAAALAPPPPPPPKKSAAPAAKGARGRAPAPVKGKPGADAIKAARAEKARLEAIAAAAAKAEAARALIERSGTPVDYHPPDPETSKPVADEDFKLLLKYFSSPLPTQPERLLLLYILSRAHFYNCTHVKQLIDCATCQFERVEIAVTFFPNVIDVQNFESVVLADMKAYNLYPRVHDRLAPLLAVAAHDVQNRPPPVAPPPSSFLTRPFGASSGPATLHSRPTDPDVTASTSTVSPANSYTSSKPVLSPIEHQSSFPKFVDSLGSQDSDDNLLSTPPPQHGQSP